MKTDRIKKAASHIISQVKSQHEDLDYQPKQRSPEVGQWLVYGFERYFGLGGAVELESVVETAWRKGQDLEASLVQFLTKKIK